MYKFNSSFIIVLIGSWVLITEVQGKGDQAIAVYEMELLGTIQARPQDVEKAQGEDTSGYSPQQRQQLCDGLNKNQVVNIVKTSYQHSCNVLSGEDPGDTKVYRVLSGEGSSRGMIVLGFVCKAAEGSYSFVTVRKPKVGWTAYVPKTQPIST